VEAITREQPLDILVLVGPATVRRLDKNLTPCARAARKVGIPYVLSPRGMLVKDLIARRSRLAKSAWIHLIERANVEQAAALHLTSQLEGGSGALIGDGEAEAKLALRASISPPRELSFT
jgi:hypothetical protein